MQFSVAGYLPQAYNNRQSLASGDPVTVTYGQATTGIDASLVRGATIAGTVTDASTHAGVLNALVTAYDTQGSPVASAFTSTAGGYQLTVPAGSYKVGFSEGANQNYLPQYYSGQASLSAATQITVATGQNATGIDAALQAGGQITGTVTDSSTGSPVSGILVYAMTTTGQFLTSAQTNSQGGYSLGGLTTGSYTIEFSTSSSTQNYLPQYYNNRTTLQNADAVSVTAGQATTGINAAMQPGGQITGTVTSSATGKPIAGVQVTASAGSTYDNATTDANGNYTLNNLPTGSYQVYFSDPQGLHLPQYYDDAATSANATSVAVTAGQGDPGINATLAAAGRITGSVLDAESGGPVSGATVTLYDAGDDYVTSTSTDSTGSYSFGPLTAGQYEVSFATGSSGGNYGTAYYNGKSTLLTADPVTVTNEATTSGVNGRLTSLPVNTGLPTISGTAQQGKTLTEVNGKWTHRPTSYSYQWLRCQAGGTSCSWIPNATAPDLHRDGRRRRRRPRGCRDRHERRRARRSGHVSVDEGRPAGAAGRPGPAADQRPGRGGTDADRDAWAMDEPSDVVQRAVAALRRLGRQLHLDQRSDRADVRAGGVGRRADARCHRVGRERRRNRCGGTVRADRRRRTPGADEQEPAGHLRHANEGRPSPRATAHGRITDVYSYQWLRCDSMRRTARRSPMPMRRRTC